MRRLLSVLMAAFMLLTLPLTTGIARAVADGTAEQPDTETPSEGIALEMEEMDPAKLHVHKLGEEDEEEDDGFDPGELEITDINKIVRASIFLDGKSTIDMGYDTQGIANNSSATAYRNKLRKQQETMQAKIENELGHSLTVKWNLTLLVNAISVEIPYKDVAVIRGMEGVRKVELETQYEAPKPVSVDPNTANTSENMVGATNAWYNLGYTGAGSRVAIIDTGLDTDHQSVNNDAFLHAIEEVRAEGKTVELMSSIPSGLNGAGARISDKIPFVYNYIDGGTRVNHQDGAGNHGSHVAGIAAANRYIKQGSNYVDAAQTVKAVGMAPDAQILVMKVFGQGGGAYDSDYFAALEDAIVLGADAANLSLGSAAPGWTYDTEYQATLNKFVDNANNHMVVAISAGNSDAYDDHTNHKLYAEDAYFHTGGSPGSFINSLGVAAAQNTLTEGTPLVFDGNLQVFYAEDLESSDGVAYTTSAMTTVAGTWDYVYIDAKGTADDYATVNGAVSLSGKIVIMNRGELSFVEKGENVKSYSPKALIVANNTEGVIHMDLTDFTGTFPYVAITLKDANKIKEGATAHTAGDITYYTGSVQVTTTSTSTVTPREEAEVTSFSSWGVPGSLLMKPEIVAPGGDINSIYGTSNASSDAGSGTTAYAVFSGTSMAAPHITGLSAVLMQYLKEVAPANTDLVNGYTLRAIAQSLLMSTATPMINSNAFVSILQQGAGLVEVSKAIEAKSVIMMDDAYLTTDTGAAADGKVKVELGDDPARKGEYDYKFTIYNISDETLTFELDTALFTQAVSGDTLSHKTTLLPFEGVTYEWDGQTVAAEGHDVDKDGDTDDDDAQAILDMLSGEIDVDDENYDFTVADMDGDELVTSYDAHLLLNWEAGEAAEGYVIAAHDKAQVTVHIRLTDAQKAELNREERRGAYIEGYTYVDCVTTTDEGLDLDHEHTIPILGYFGSWTDPEMFDTNSYTENLYGNEQLNYSGATAAGTNYMRVTTNGTLAKFSGNPYMVEEEFPESRLAIRSDAKINNIAYNLIRSAAGTGFAISKLGEDGNVESIVTSSVNGQEVYGAWYHVNNASWQNTATMQYNVNKALNEFNGLADGDRVRVGFYAIPEYNTMLESSDLTSANAGILTDSMFRSILTSNVLGKGAFVGFDLTIDDVDPVIVGAPTLTGNTLSITASDDKNIAYIGILSLDGTVKYAEVAPGTNEYTVSLDASDAIANASGYVAAFVGDYAGNEAAYAIKVNDNTHVEKTVYVLTNTLTAGEKYLIVDRNTAGSGHGLAYTPPTSANATTANVLVYNPSVKAGIADTNNQPYIESADAAATGIWTAASGITLTNVNGTKTWYMGRSNNNNLTIGTAPANRNWSYDGTNNRLANGTRYLRYYNNTFSLNTSTNYKMYIYVETTISYEVDPYSVMSVTVTPNTLDLYKGDTANLTAKVAPLTATDRTVTWSSDDPSIATVNEVGIVTAVAAGTTTIKATSNSDPTKVGECTVNVVAINKELSAAIWDEEGDVYFSYFNTNNLPTWTKRHTTPTTEYITSAMMADASNLYAATNDLSVGNIYTVNRTSYALTLEGENYVVPFGMAPVGSSFGSGYFVYAFAKYLIFGNLAVETDDELGTYCGFPYGLLDLSATNVGDAYAVAICIRNRSTTSAGYYFLDETGKIWQTNQSYSNTSGITFGAPTLVYDTGINAGLQYNSIYYDGTNLYWSHQDGNEAVVYILANANTAASRKFYRAGNFGDGVWPAAGLYVNGSVAPSFVGGEDEIMSEELVGTLNLKPLMTREQLMTPDIMARLAAAKNNSKGVVDAVEEAIELPELPVEEPIEEPVEEPAEPEEDGAPRAHFLRQVTGTAGEGGVIPFSEDEASTNGLFAVVYPEELTCTANAKGTAENLFVSIHVDAEKGVVTVAYAMKDKTPLAAGTPIATLTFETEECEVEGTIEIDTLERGEEVELDEINEIEFPGIGHDWDTPTYTWELVDGAWTCTATAICLNNSEHVQTETVTAVRTEENDKAVYTATFENELFETRTKEVELGYYLVGSITDWALVADDAHKFVPNPDNAAEYMLPITLAEGAEFKAVRAEGDTIIGWYPDQNPNYVVGANQAGDVTVYFRPDGQGGDGWHYGYLYIAATQTYLAVKIESLGEAFVFDGVEHTKHEYLVTYGAEGDADYVSAVVTVIEDNGVAYFTLPTGDQIVITPDPEAKIMHAQDSNDAPVANTFTYTIENADRYESVTTVFGKLTMTPRPVTINIVGNTATVTYNGEEQSVIGFEWTTEDAVFMAATTESGFGVVGAPAQGSEERDLVAKGTQVGTYQMNVSGGVFGVTQALPQSGEYTDYTHWLHDFEVEFVIVSDGSLTITPRPITIKVTGNTLTVPYDGEEHQVDGFTYTCDDEVFMAEINAAQTVTLQSPDKPRAVGTEVGTYYMGLDASGKWVFLVAGTIEGGIPDFKIENFDYTIEIVSDGWLEITAPLEEPEFMSQSLLLADQLGVRFYVKLPAIEGYVYDRVDFTITGHDGDAYASSVAYSEDLPKNNAGHYGFTFYENTVQMADTITATLYYTKNGEQKTLVKEYAVKEYFEAFDAAYAEAPEAFTKPVVDMIKATADLGHYVQIYLDESRTEWSVENGDHAEMDKFYTTYTADDVAEATEAVASHALTVEGTCTDIKNLGFALYLDSATSLRVTIVPASGFTGTFTATVDGEEATVTKVSKTKYMVEVKGIMANGLSKKHTIVIGTENGSVTLTGSGLTYVQMMLRAGASNANIQNAAVAIYRYSKYADILKPE